MIPTNINYSLLTGRHETARYKKTPVPIYQNNPLIEALPHILSKREAIRRLTNRPPYSPSNRQLSVEDRLHCVNAIPLLVQPSTTMIRLENMFSRIIRMGYTNRNPYCNEFWKNLDQNIERLVSSESQGYRCRSNINGTPISGISGIGKSTAINAICDLYPQDIDHGMYKNSPFVHTQVVWMKIDCPGDASVKGLCLSYLLAMDEKLGTNYYYEYANNGRATVDTLLPAMARVAGFHSLGVLIVDEAQNLSEANVGGERKILNYLVQLENIVGVPVILVGTSKLLPILGQNEFRQARRMTGEGALIWDRMKQDDDDWQILIEALFRYQYTKEKCALTNELSDTLYYYSQGITDVTVKLFKLGQIRAIETGKERISTSIFRSVSHDSLSLLEPALRALRNNDSEAIRRFDDIFPIWKQRIGELPVGKRKVELSRSEEEKPLPDAPQGHNPDLLLDFKEAQHEELPIKQARKYRSKGKNKSVAANNLIGILANAIKSQTPAYEAFNKAGFTRSTL